MKTSHGLLSLVASITIGLLASVTLGQDIGSSTAAYPRLKFESLKYDFGHISDRENPETDLRFTNEGEAPLIITSFRAMCGCLETNIADEHLALEPGETGLLNVKFHPEEREGEYRKSIVIRSNDPDQSMLKIDIFADIDPVMSMMPRQMMFTNHVIGREQSHVMKIQSFREGFEVTEISVEDESIVTLELESDEEVEDEKYGKGRLYTYRFHAPAFDEPGSVACPAVLKTKFIDIDGKAYETEIDFSVSIQIVGPVEYQPKYVAMLRNNPGAYVTRAIRLRSRTGEPFRILSAEVVVEHPDMQTWATVNTMGSEEGALNHTLRVSASLPTKPEMIEGHVLITTDIPNFAEFEIPFRAEVIERRKP